MRKAYRYVLGLFLIAAAVLVLCQVSGEAQADTHVYTGAGANALASNNDNWNIVGSWSTHTAPAAGDNVIFNTTSSNKACTWNLANNSFGSFQTVTGYSGVITQSSEMFVNSMTLSTGTFTASTTNILHCSGSLTRSGATWTTIKGIVELSGTGYFTGTFSLQKLTISGIYIGNGTTVTLNPTSGSVGLIVNGTFTIKDSGQFAVYDASILGINITGKLLKGSGYSLVTNPILLLIGGSTTTHTFLMGRCTGTIEWDVQIQFSSASAENTIKLSSNAHFIHLYLFGASGKPFNLDLNGYNLIADYINLGNYGYIRNSAATNSWLFIKSTLYNTTTGAIFTIHLYVNYYDWQPSLLNSPSSEATNGVAYSFTPSFNETGINTVFAGPAWSSYAGGIVSGTPSVNGVYQFWLNATSQNGTLTLRTTWTVDVNDPVIAGAALGLLSSALTTISEDQAYFYDCDANQLGTYSIVTNASWASFNIGASTLYGTPDNGDVGWYHVSIVFVNSNGTLYDNFTLTVANVAPGFTSTPGGIATAGQDYSYYPATNQSAWVTFSLLSDSADLYLDLSGVHGTMTTAGVFWVNVTADDGKGGVVWQNYTIVVISGAGGSSQWSYSVLIRSEEAKVPALTVQFGYEPRNPDQFDVSRVTKVWWNFGDGNGSMNADPEHRYAQPGIYTVTVAIFDDNGSIGYSATEVNVGGVAASFGDEMLWFFEARLIYVLAAFACGIIAIAVYMHIAPKHGGKNPLVVLLMLAIMFIVIMEVYGIGI